VKEAAVEHRWGGPKTALAGLLALAAALRLVGIEYGLPFPLLNPDEANIVPRAWRVVHGGGLDPHFFDYPSALIYAEAPFQSWHADPSYLTAHLVLVALALAGVAAAWWLGRAAYGQVAGFVAGAFVAVDTAHVFYSRTAVTDVPLTTAATVALALLVTGRLEWAGVAIGLAASFKYPGLLLLAPLLVVGWRSPPGSLRSRSRSRALTCCSTSGERSTTSAGFSGSRTTAGSGSSTIRPRPSPTSNGSGTDSGRPSSSLWPESSSRS
jgi:4-amino-4-deoxy-L-arabinose transferase-like glycosyltransferase